MKGEGGYTGYIRKTLSHWNGTLKTLQRDPIQVKNAHKH
jgi:hypothetical protein